MTPENQEYNFKLCEERHDMIEDFLKNVTRRLEKVENRFIIFLSLLTLNLIGVIATLTITLLTKS